MSMQTYHYRVSLRIWHPSEDPSAFSAVLGLAPTHVDVAGRPRVRKGKTLAYVPVESYWSHDFGTDEGLGIEEYLSVKADRLECHKEFFARLCDSGGRAELFIGFYLDALNCGMVLPPELQRKYARLRLGLSFDIYGLDSARNDGR